MRLCKFFQSILFIVVVLVGVVAAPDTASANVGDAEATDAQDMKTTTSVKSLGTNLGESHQEELKAEVKQYKKSGKGDTMDTTKVTASAKMYKDRAGDAETEGDGIRAKVEGEDATASAHIGGGDVEVHAELSEAKQAEAERRAAELGLNAKTEETATQELNALRRSIVENTRQSRQILSHLEFELDEDDFLVSSIDQLHVEHKPSHKSALDKYLVLRIDLFGVVLNFAKHEPYDKHRALHPNEIHLPNCHEFAHSDKPEFEIDVKSDAKDPNKFDKKAFEECENKYCLKVGLRHGLSGNRESKCLHKINGCSGMFGIPCKCEDPAIAKPSTVYRRVIWRHEFRDDDDDLYRYKLCASQLIGRLRRHAELNGDVDGDRVFKATYMTSKGNIGVMPDNFKRVYALEARVNTNVGNMKEVFEYMRNNWHVFDHKFYTQFESMSYDYSKENNVYEVYSKDTKTSAYGFENFEELYASSMDAQSLAAFKQASEEALPTQYDSTDYLFHTRTLESVRERIDLSMEQSKRFDMQYILVQWKNFLQRTMSKHQALEEAVKDAGESEAAEELKGRSAALLTVAVYATKFHAEKTAFRRLLKAIKMHYNTVERLNKLRIDIMAEIEKKKEAINAGESEESVHRTDEIERCWIDECKAAAHLATFSVRSRDSFGFKTEYKIAGQSMKETERRVNIADKGEKAEFDKYGRQTKKRNKKSKRENEKILKEIWFGRENSNAGQTHQSSSHRKACGTEQDILSGVYGEHVDLEMCVSCIDEAVDAINTQHRGDVSMNYHALQDFITVLRQAEKKLRRIAADAVEKLFMEDVNRFLEIRDHKMRVPKVLKNFKPKNGQLTTRLIENVMIDTNKIDMGKYALSNDDMYVPVLIKTPNPELVGIALDTVFMTDSPFRRGDVDITIIGFFRDVPGRICSVNVGHAYTKHICDMKHGGSELGNWKKQAINFDSRMGSFDTILEQSQSDLWAKFQTKYQRANHDGDYNWVQNPAAKSKKEDTTTEASNPEQNGKSILLDCYHKVDADDEEVDEFLKNAAPHHPDWADLEEELQMIDRSTESGEEDGEKKKKDLTKSDHPPADYWDGDDWVTKIGMEVMASMYKSGRPGPQKSKNQAMAREMLRSARVYTYVTEMGGVTCEDVSDWVFEMASHHMKAERDEYGIKLYLQFADTDKNLIAGQVQATRLKLQHKLIQLIKAAIYTMGVTITQDGTRHAEGSTKYINAQRALDSIPGKSRYVHIIFGRGDFLLDHDSNAIVLRFGMVKVSIDKNGALDRGRKVTVYDLESIAEKLSDYLTARMSEVHEFASVNAAAPTARVEVKMKGGTINHRNERVEESSEGEPNKGKSDGEEPLDPNVDEDEPEEVEDKKDEEVEEESSDDGNGAMANSVGVVSVIVVLFRLIVG